MAASSSETKSDLDMPNGWTKPSKALNPDPEVEIGFRRADFSCVKYLCDGAKDFFLDIGDGERFSFVRRIIPDVTFINSTNSPRLDMIIKTQNYPGSNYQNGSDSEIVRTATVPVEQYTQVKDIRLRGRSIILRIESNRVGTCWRLGSPRVEIQQDGRR
jgi:hypothetical protein